MASRCGLVGTYGEVSDAISPCLHLHVPILVVPEALPCSFPAQDLHTCSLHTLPPSPPPPGVMRLHSGLIH